MMKAITTVLIALITATPATAISRYNSQSLSCDQVRQKVWQERAAVLRYPSPRIKGLTLYDRYVSDNRQCSPHEYAGRSFVPTKDTKRCPVLNCQDWEPLPGQRMKPNIPF